MAVNWDWILLNLAMAATVVAVGGIGAAFFVWWVRRQKKEARKAKLPPNAAVTRGTIYHRGLAEALGLTPAQLEGMTIRELATLAFRQSGRVDVDVHSGVGIGLTLSAKNTEPAVDQAG